MTDPTAQTLKPCPFCGDNSVAVRSEWIASPVEYMAQVYCRGCDVAGPMSEYKHDAEEDAITDAIGMWNTRAPDPSMAARLEKAEALAIYLDCAINGVWLPHHLEEARAALSAYRGEA